MSRRWRFLEEVGRTLVAVRRSSYIRVDVTIEVNGQIRMLGVDVSSVI